MKRLGFALLLIIPAMLAAQNNAPVVLNPLVDFAMQEDTNNTSINLNDVFYDADGEALVFTYGGQTHIGVTISNGLVILSPAANWNGSETITFTATDSYGASASDDVTVTVAYVNDAPTVYNPIATYSLAFNGSSSGLNLLQVFRDVDIVYGDALTFTCTGDFHVNVSISGSIVTLAPAYNWAGSESIAFIAHDNTGATASHSILITVTPPAIANVSVSPNPFSPDYDGEKDDTVISWYLSGNGVVTIEVADENDIPVFTEDVQATSGWNQYVWDGYSNVGAYSGTIVPDGSYGLNMYCGSASYEIDFTIKVDTSPPTIDLIAAFPNPFSPNGDGFQDFHQVRFRVEDTIVRYIGLIRVNLWREQNDPSGNYVATHFVQEDCNGGPVVTVPDISVFDELTDGGYLFVIRSSDTALGHENTLSSGATYDLIIGGNGSSEYNKVTVSTGVSMYKIGDVQYPYLTVSGVGADDHEEDAEDNTTGYDYLRLFVMEGNATFNIYEDNGDPYCFTDLFPIYYGAAQNLLHPVYGTPMFSDFQYNNTIPGTIEVPEAMMGDGRYIWRTIITDQAMHAAEESGELLVNNFPVHVTGTIEPEQISPGNEDGYYDQAIIQYQVTERSYVTIKIWDEEQTQVLRTLADALETNESGYLIWDGTDDNGDAIAENDQTTCVIEITAQDVNISEDIVSEHISIAVDNVGPEAPTIFLPGGQLYVETPGITMGGISNDISSSVLLYLNGVYQGVVATTPSYPGYFSFPVTLEEGENTIYVKLRDQAYNLGAVSNSISVNLDSSSPVIDVTYPPADTLFRVNSFRVRASISDLEGIGVDPSTVKFGFSLYGNNISWRNATHTANSTDYYYDYTVGEGIEELEIAMYVQASDLLGNLGITPDTVFFTYRAVIPPDILTHSPADSSIVCALPGGYAASIIYDNEGEGLNQNESWIWLVNPAGVVLNGSKVISNVGQSLYLVKFTPTEAMADGWYQYITYVTDNYAGGGSVAADTTVFLYDATNPAVTNTLVGNDSFATPISNEMIINHSITYVSLDAADLNGVNTASCSLRLYNAQNNVISGEKSISGNTITWTLDNEILVNEANSGGYSMRYTVVDVAGNTVTGRIDFTLAASNAPQVTVRYPARNSYIAALSGNTVSITFNEAVGISTNFADTWLTLTTPEGTVLRHGSGATQAIDTSGDPQFILTLTLDDPIATLGNYEVNLRITNLNNIVYAETYAFTLDNIAPTVDSYAVGLEDTSTQTIFGGEELDQAVVYGQTTLADNFLLNLSECTLELVEVDGGAISGALAQLSGNRLRWTLDEPLTDIHGQYRLVTRLADMAGNTVTDSVQFSISTVNLRFWPEENAVTNDDIAQVRVELVEVQQEDITPGGCWVVVTHPDGTLIGDPDLPGGGSGAQLGFAYTDSLTTITLAFDQALSSLGVDDGDYSVQLHLALPDDDPLNVIYGFRYDRTKPAYANLRVNEEPVAQLTDKNVSISLYGAHKLREENGWLRDNVYTGRIDSLAVEYTDATSGVSPSPNLTYLFLSTADDTPIAGRKVVSGNTYRWVLNTPILPDSTSDGDYKIKLKVSDRAGNQRTQEVAFTLVSDPTPELVGWEPWGLDYTYVYTHELDPAVFSAEFKDYFGLVEEYDHSYIRVVCPSGDSLYHPHGGDLIYEDTDSTSVVTFTLDGNLHTNGEDDGLYTIRVVATNEVGAVYNKNQYMMYDTVVPYTVEVGVIDNDDVLWTVGNDTLEVNNGISALRVKYGDVTSGLYYAPHLTQVTLYDPNGVLVPGSHAYGEWVEADSLVYWNLANALSGTGADDGLYSIHLMACDKAGNAFTQEIPVKLFSPMTPTDFAWEMDAVYRVHLTWQHYVPGSSRSAARKQVASRNEPAFDARDLEYYRVQRRVDGGAWVTLGYTTANYWTDDLLNEPDGSYQYSLQAFYTAGYSDLLLTGSIAVKRFAALLVQVTEADGSTLIEGVLVRLLGNDGLYNMNLEGVTGAGGTVAFNDVFMDSYTFTLSKDGYQTLTTQATVEEDPTTLVFQLPTQATPTGGIPRYTVLLQNYPNPFNPDTFVRFGLCEDSEVTITVYNIKGQRVLTLLNETRGAGYHVVRWDGHDESGRTVGNGIYLCLLQARGANTNVRDMSKMILLK